MRFAIGILLCFFSSLSFSQDAYLVVGTYDSPKSEGIFVYRFSNDGSATEISHVKTSNPSFVTISPDQRFVYAVNENADSTGKGGGITAFSFDKKTGTLTEMNKRSSMGNHPCYISIDKTGKWLAVANYSSGNLSIYNVLADGSIGNLSDTIQYSGRGYHETSQKGPHVHSTVFSPDNKNLLVTDLGLDKIISYDFDQEKGTLKKEMPYTVHVRPGLGPRHLDFHPSGKYVYIMYELGSRVDTYGWIDGKLIATGKTLTSVAKNYTGPASSADIHVSPDGKFVYASNRANANDIAVFSINKEDGSLVYRHNYSTLGKTPRNFNFDPSGNFLLAANQNSDEIVVFSVDKKTGVLTDSGKRIAVGKPVCIKWMTL